MRIFSLVLGLLSAVTVHASETEPVFRTQDNVDFIVLVKSGLSSQERQACMDQVCKISAEQGTGSCEAVFNIGETLILGANLTTFGADQVAGLTCIDSVEVEQVMHANPSLGRSN